MLFAVTSQPFNPSQKMAAVLAFLCMEDKTFVSTEFVPFQPFLPSAFWQSPQLHKTPSEFV